MHNHRTCVRTQTPSLFPAFKHYLYISICMFLVFSFSVSAVSAQPVSDTAYEKVISERALKIVNSLELDNQKKFNKVHELIKNQYFSLNRIHSEHKAQLAALKLKSDPVDQIKAAQATNDAKKNTCLRQLHENFVGLLKKQLSVEQIEKVKDGMTYRILPVTWTAYLDMLQQLTEDQKKQMYAWLVEARELAMDEGSSDQKHAVFGKYKGRINNYLSAAGYDMKKEGEEWQKRIAAAKEAKSKN